MTDPVDINKAARLLATYDAMRHDLDVMPSPTLAQRLEECRTVLLTATGVASVDEARLLVPAPRPVLAAESLPEPPATPAAAPRSSRSSQPPEPRQTPQSNRVRVAGKKRQTKTAKKKRLQNLPCRCRWCSSATKTQYRPAQPPRVTSVVSGGLPGSSRRH